MRHPLPWLGWEAESAPPPSPPCPPRFTYAAWVMVEGFGILEEEVDEEEDEQERREEQVGDGHHPAGQWGVPQ